MTAPHDSSQPPPDGDAGVRVIDKPRPRRPHMAAWAIGALVLGALVLAVTAWWPREGRSGAPVQGMQARAAAGGDAGTASTGAVVPAARLAAARRAADEPLAASDPNDLASYFRPGDPEPTGREVIEALHEAGVRTGIGAFNPPGTSPPLVGLAVPADFPLPPGYVRHHQVTDEGVPLEPILMFAPDFALTDARGRALPMPADRVVPPHLAPPGLPLRRIAIPAPP